MSGQNKVSGVVLAGGMARRMQEQDKGLLLCNNRPLVSYALAAMTPLVDELLISANRNQDLYQQFNYRVISDAEPSFDGPLAGILAAMQAAQHPTLLIAPCDSPLVATIHLQRLLDTLLAQDAEIAVAFDGERLHPVFAALRTELQLDLQNYLCSGERKLQSWFHRHLLVEVDFSDTPHIFANINTPAELADLEHSLTDPPQG
ncbi:MULTISPECIES: molybdenum cofactor guanylyltransferase MobA [Methylomonas]|uniref:Molybdenum cofactor guanylyltransferase n=2 Tax=Methylomonas TaxID=416 RepID=A0A126T162_9GAMM|nr:MULTISPECIES: molybdenum cofactor guanylyltransferase MobA [Methylomonas]AMK75819.1 molybdenum cofactor guanylyltransferase [Methylomonas denitrificans]OAH98574.1 molybdenum cofactor guanylyltransferase [Methylomonas methanica]TCV80176.1 molybdenum cofactor guanylyltransferase [Methylomonas methanica]